jgi:hypothetical protein
VVTIESIQQKRHQSALFIMKNGRGRKTAVFLLVCVGTGFIFLLAAILNVPRFIGRKAVLGKARREVSKLAEGEYDFMRIDLSFSPTLHVLLADAALNFPERITASVKVIEVHLEILPLASRSNSPTLAG